MSDDHVLVNRATWDADASNWVERGRTSWAEEDPTWGLGNKESALRLLERVSGLDAVELGCGTGYVSAWLARRGADVVGLDNSRNQLATARLFQNEFDLRFPLVHGDAEHAPFADGSFDFAISQYGAAIWCDPYRWIPEAARILRPGGRLVFETGSPLVMCCFPLDDDEAPAEAVLHRDYFGMRRFDWRNPEGVVEDIEFRIGHGEMLRLLWSSGFEVEDLIELQATGDAEASNPYIPVEWARRWPSAEIWRARKKT